MGIFRKSRALRATILAGAITWLGSPADLIAAPFGIPDREPAEMTAQPFGLPATVISYGGLWEKWAGVQHRLDDENVQLALCDGDRERCVSAAALQFLTIVDAGRAREGRARLGEVNRAINLAIRPMSDLAQHGAEDVWSSPLVTFTSGAGDCEDYAIAKYVALLQAGVSSANLRIVILHDTIHGEDHAVVAARLDGHWLMLDNRRMAMIEDGYVRNYQPSFVIDQYGLMKYVDEPLLAGTSADVPDFAAQPGTITAHN